jgi:YgiT-type zinc finger domain-containing protein
MKQNETRCPICKGYKQSSTTTFTVDLKFGVVVVRDVPATVCEQCGEEWIGDKEAEQLESIVNNARAKHTMIEVANFSDLLKVAS